MVVEPISDRVVAVGQEYSYCYTVTDGAIVVKEIYQDTEVEIVAYSRAEGKGTKNCTMTFMMKFVES